MVFLNPSLSCAFMACVPGIWCSCRNPKRDPILFFFPSLSWNVMSWHQLWVHQTVHNSTKLSYLFAVTTCLLNIPLAISQTITFDRNKRALLTITRADKWVSGGLWIAGPACCVPTELRWNSKSVRWQAWVVGLIDFSFLFPFCTASDLQFITWIILRLQPCWGRCVI